MESRYFPTFRFAVGVVVVALLSGCDQTHQVKQPLMDRYQAIAGSDGTVWRLDKSNGEMKACFSFSPANQGPACYKAVEK